MNTSLRISRRGAPAGTCVLAVTGEIDFDTAPALARSLDAALTGPPVPATLVVDCSALTFCGSAGLNVLLVTRKRAARTNITLSLAAPNPQLLRLLRMTGADALFTLTTAPTTYP
ncbi:STAS domain-containing protein [Streptomyces sp. NPDC097619]|uniref:STAS domain-containing protein n=1 Tax=Streptomyces sp. NPDC097619 TaxID=3157228 RepID=UPI00331B4A43